MYDYVKTIAVIAVTALALIVFVVTLARATVYAPEEEISVQDPPPASQASASDLPERLLIPALAIDAKVQHVGISRSGNMAVPTNYSDVGWYRYGVAPGFLGSAVMDGHLDNGFGLDAVFNRIKELEAGDLITVVTRDGEELNFKVEEVATYEKAEVPRVRIFNRADKARLNLITCEGDWDAATKDYSERVVVYAVLV